MESEQRITPTSKYYLRLVLVPLVILTILRIIFWTWFNESKFPANPSEIVYAFYLGFKFDVRLIFLCTLPTFFLGWIRPINPKWSRRGTKIWGGYWVIVMSTLLLCYFIDFAYYGYLGSRVNATAIRFLLDPVISAKMVWQSYPIIMYSMVIICFGFVYWWVMQLFVFAPVRESIINVSVKKAVINNLAVLAILLAGLYGKLSFYPLRWSEAFFSSNSFVSSLSLNPVLYFFDTFKFRSVSYDKDVVKKYYPIVSKYLGVKSPDAEKLTFQRDVRPADERLKPPNIVIIVMESLASFKTAASGNAMSATPNIDSLAKKSLYFSNYFSPSEGTARSIFTLLTGIPDVNSHKTSSRNPIIVSQNLIINSFKNHKKFYFIGGSASWGNIRGVLSHNIPDLNLVEEGNFEAPRTDVWGISDYDLFLEANQRLSKLEDDTPFFAIIQTAGYHRPYTIPSKVGSFKLKDITAQQAKDNGYISKEEYNSLRFADFGLGEFIELAKKKPYFDNTLFVIIGDHGLPDEKAKHLKPGVILYSLERWHTPLIFYGPSFFPEPQVLEKPASEIDIMTTVAAFAGIKHTNTTMGRNLFTDTYDSSRYAFLFTYYNQPPGIGLINDTFYTKCIPGKCLGLFEYKSATPNIDVSDQFPDKAQEMTELTQGIYETSKYLLYNNPNPIVGGQNHNTASK